MRIVKRLCAFIIGVVFLFAGLLKLMDPVGAGLVVEEYLKFLHAGFFVPAAKFLGIGMALLECILGAGLVTGVWPRQIGAATGIVLLCFTALTLVLWIMNPSMDCGCFGEAIHLTHFQSFLKNVILSVLWIVAFIPFSSLHEPRKMKYASFFLVTLSVLLFSAWSYFTIPQLDFTEFKPGVLLLQAPEATASDSPLLSVCDAGGEYRDEDLAAGPVLVISAYDYDQLSPEKLERIEGLRAEAAKVGITAPLVVCGEIPPEGTYSSDRRMLMSLNRSNGGATLFSEGLLIAKWPIGRYPSGQLLGSLLKGDSTEAMMQENAPRRLRLQGFLLYVFAVLLLL